MGRLADVKLDVVVLRATSIVTLLLALGVSAWPGFIVVDVGMPGPRIPISQSAWSGWGVVGGALILVALMLVMAALIVSAYSSVASKAIDCVTAVVVVAAAASFVGLLFTQDLGSQVGLELGASFGGAGFATLALLFVAAVLAIVSATRRVS